MSKRPALHRLDRVSSGDMLEVTPLEELHKILECPICHTIPSAPIYLCLTGHNICGNCRPKLESCAFCHFAFTDCRNFAIESIISTSSFACENLERGCNVVAMGLELEGHRKHCEFRPIKCPQEGFQGCENSAIEFADFLTHMQTVHVGSLQSRKVGRAITVAHELPDVSVLNYKWPLHYFLHDEKIFVVRSFLLQGTFHFALALLAVDSAAMAYTGRIRFKLPGDREKLPFKTTMPIIPIRTTNAEIVQKRIHVTLTKDMILPFLLKDRAGMQDNSIAWDVLYDVYKPDLLGSSKLVDLTVET